jgi:type VI secretion system secreted protein VgrG
MSAATPAPVSYAQRERLLSLETPLGPDVLLCRRFLLAEALSRPFSMSLDLLGTRDDIRPAEIVGKPVVVALRLTDGGERHFHGLVREFRAGPLEMRDLRRYTAEVVPWLWFLGLATNCRFFQGRTVTQILETVFRAHGFADFDLGEVRGSHPELEHCVQYRETDLAFVSRLMEERGIFYRFRHEKGRHVLVAADHKGAYADCPDREVAFTRGSLAEDHLDGWDHAFRFGSGRWAQNDYNFETPAASLLTRASTLVRLPEVERYEVYDYPGAYPDKDLGDSLTRIRMEEVEAAHDVVEATGRVRTLFPGGRFRLRVHDCADEANAEHLVTSVSHEARDDTYGQLPGTPGSSYTMSMACIPSRVTFRPPRQTPRPYIHGVQTAVVVGPEGDEIYTDDHGRIRVRFHWDRDGKQSCWIRVAQGWAGTGWGAWFVPRIGQEVVVAFLEGDPDRPLVIGSVHNAALAPPYGTQDSINKSGIRSRSSKGGGAGNYNELMFDDTKGSEQVSLKAEKDQHITVGNDETHGVTQDRSKTVGRHETTKVGGNRTETVDGNENISVGQSRKEAVTAHETIAIGGSRKETVTGSETIAIGQGRTETVIGGETIDITGPRTETVKGPEAVTIVAGRAHTVLVGEALSVTGPRGVQVTGGETKGVTGSRSVTVGAGQSYKITGGRSADVTGADKLDVKGDRSAQVSGSDTVKVGKSLHVTATDSITLEVGSAKIVLKSNGDISINGQHLTLDGSGKIKIEASNNVIVKGQQVKAN